MPLQSQINNHTSTIRDVMNVIFRIRGMQPESGEGPRFEDFAVDVEPTDRLLDGLMLHQADPRRHVVLPQELRPRHLRLRRHADQRRRAARLQDPRSGRRQRRERGGDVRAAQSAARAAGPHGGLRPVLRDLSRGETVPRSRRSRSEQASASRRPADRSRVRRSDEMHPLRLVLLGLPGGA